MSQTITTPSPGGLAFIKRYQGLSLEKYIDTQGLWVIGYGHLIRDRERFDELISREQAEWLFLQDVELYQQLIAQCITVPINQNQFDALMSLAFSLGPEGIQHSVIVQAINRRHYSAALALWQREGEKQNSLAIQRQAEAALFQTDPG